MIKSIKIKDFALIKDMEVEFGDGLNIITGETGAGKSSFISAISFVLGERADKSNIRTNCEFAKIEAVFDISNNIGIKNTLNDLGLPYDDILIISRKINQEGKSDIKLNGETINLTMLKKISCHLADIYGQHEQQSLLNKEMHLVFLDNYLGKSIEDAKNDLSLLLNQKREIENKIANLGGDEFSREREKDMLNFQIEELERAELKKGEEEDLISKKRKMENYQRVFDAIKICRELLTEGMGNSVSENCYTSKKILGNIASLDENFAELSNRLETLEIEAKDISETLETKINEFDFNEYEFQKIDERLDLIKSLKRKYGSTIEEILTFLESSKNRLIELEDTEELLEKNNIELQAINNKINNLCSLMTDLRKQGAQQLCKNVVMELSQLGMKNATFNVEFTMKQPQSDGADDVEFMFSANLGEPLKPLIKVISGGEMSRFMLAFKVVMGNLQSINSLIFDEIDSGISGIVSLEVGKKLAKLASNNQIIAITHLATIASFANCHFQIKKNIVNGTTYSLLVKLDTNGQLSEIARLAGGNNASKIGLEHAQELKLQAQKFMSAIK